MINMDNKLKESLERLKEFKELLKGFSSKEDAIKYLVKETGVLKEECFKVYDFIMKLDLEKE